VISNPSLARRPEVARALHAAGWVSVTVDTVDRRAWRRLNRPHRDLQLPTVVEGICCFSAECGGELVSETMVVDGINEGEPRVEDTARFLAGAGIGTVHLAVLIRPPTVVGARPPAAAVVNRSCQIMAEWVPRVELLATAEDDTFASGGGPGSDIPAICAVHPMRESAVRALLAGAHAPWSTVEHLVSEGLLQKVPCREVVLPAAPQPLDDGGCRPPDDDDLVCLPGFWRHGAHGHHLRTARTGVCRGELLGFRLGMAPRSHGVAALLGPSGGM